MNYFEFYELPVSFHPDQNLVKRKFYTLSKEFHPDFYVNEPEERQQEILGLSTLNNKAFQTLSDEYKLLAYILQIKGELEEGEKYTLPQDFLMEMMEVNEGLVELEADEEQVKKVTQEVDDLETRLNNELATLTQTFDHAVVPDQKAILLQIKDIYYRKKYLLRIRESINKFATRL